MSNKTKYAGYLHETGAVCLLAGDWDARMEQAHKNGVVLYEASPFTASSPSSALRKLRKILEEECPEMRKNKKDLWWAYEHVRGTISVQKFYSREEVAIKKGAAFINKVIMPFSAVSILAAEKIAKKKLNEAKYIIRGVAAVKTKKIGENVSNG
jgi:hypothetical protein